jgi:hypothetical protein
MPALPLESAAALVATKLVKKDEKIIIKFLFLLPFLLLKQRAGSSLQLYTFFLIFILHFRPYHSRL